MQKSFPSSLFLDGVPLPLCLCWLGSVVGMSAFRLLLWRELLIHFPVVEEPSGEQDLCLCCLRSVAAMVVFRLLLWRKLLIHFPVVKKSSREEDLCNNHCGYSSRSAQHIFAKQINTVVLSIRVWCHIKDSASCSRKKFTCLFLFPSFSWHLPLVLLLIAWPSSSFYACLYPPHVPFHLSSILFSLILLSSPSSSSFPSLHVSCLQYKDPNTTHAFAQLPSSYEHRLEIRSHDLSFASTYSGNSPRSGSPVFIPLLRRTWGSFSRWGWARTLSGIKWFSSCDPRDGGCHVITREEFTVGRIGRMLRVGVEGKWRVDASVKMW